MGKSAPKPPPAPDPTTIINASANASDASALTQSKLNNVNYSGPQGTVTYNYDPGSGQYTQNVLLNPTNQATESAIQADQELGANIAGEGLDSVRTALQHPLGTPGLQTGVNAGPIQTGYDSGGQIQKSIQNEPVQTGFGSSGAIQSGFGSSGPIQSGIKNPGAIQGQVAPTYSPFGMLGASGQTSPQPTHAVAPPPSVSGKASASGSAPAAPAGGQQYNAAQQAFLAQHPHPGAKGQAALAAMATPGGGGTPAPQPQPQPPAQPRAQGQPPPGQSQYDPFTAIASNPVASTQLATYLQSKQMLDPQWQQATEQQQAQLVAQGLNPNSAAYQNAMHLFGQQQNEAYNSAMFGAINAGDQEQNTLYGQNLQSGEFANSAQNQNYNQLMGEAGLANSAQSQNYGQQMGRAELTNSSQLQNYNEQMGRAQLYNSANGQLFGQNIAQGQFANSAQAQQNSQNAAAAGFYNTAQNQGYAQQMGNAQLYNQAAQQQFQNQAYADQLPINDFSALMSSSQVGMPPSAPAQNTQVSAPNALGAYQLQSGAQQDDYDQQMKSYDTNLSGLYGLGSSALGIFRKR